MSNSTNAAPVPPKPEVPEEPPSDPATAPIRPGHECTIEINKDKMGLGLSIVGGCDTLLVSTSTTLTGIWNREQKKKVQINLIIFYRVSS